MAEAKYLAIFSRDKFDFYVVQQTDNVLEEATVICRDSHAIMEKRIAAYNRYMSEDEVAQIVLKKVARRFPNPDMRRARGLISRRWEFFTTSNAPLPPPDAGNAP